MLNLMFIYLYILYIKNRIRRVIWLNVVFIDFALPNLMPICICTYIRILGYQYFKLSFGRKCQMNLCVCIVFYNGYFELQK